MNLEKFIKNIWRTLNAYKAINDLPDSVVFLDLKGFVKRANQKAVECFGFSSSYIKIDDFIKEGLKIIKESANSGAPVSATAIIPGREFCVELNARRINNGYCIAVRDLSKLTSEINNDNKVIKFNNEKNAMLVNIENDLKSPINSIMGFSQGLLTGLGGSLTEKQEKYIKIINSNATELKDYLAKLMDFTYAESSLYKPEFKNFDIVEEIKNVLKKYSSETEEKSLSIDFDYAESDKRIIYTDIKAFRIFFENIFTNSLATTEAGYISIKLKQPNEKTELRFGVNSSEMREKCIHLSIKDTGSGYSEEEIRHLCDPYSQINNGKKNFLRSLTLGCASILVKRSFGSIFISSEGTRGTTYDILLPVEKDLYE